MAVRPISKSRDSYTAIKPTSTEVFQVMENNIVGLLGTYLQNISCNCYHKSRKSCRLLASAMISGYFLRNAEQRMVFEKSLQMFK